MPEPNVSVQTNYIYDGLKERLPKGWSLSRNEGLSMERDGSVSGFYQWHRWSDGNTCLIEVHEAYIEQAKNLDQLLDQLSEEVYNSFNDPYARFTTTKWQREHATR